MPFYLDRKNAANVTREEARKLIDNASVTAVDPGEYGAAVLRNSCGALLFKGLNDWEAVSELSILPKRVVLMEDQFLGKSPSAFHETTWQSAALTGYLAALSWGMFTVIHIQPRIWQLAQQRRLGEYDGKHKNRADGIAIALRELGADAPVQAMSVNKKQREGFASAYGILRWWEDLIEDKGVKKCRTK